MAALTCRRISDARMSNLLDSIDHRISLALPDLSPPAHPRGARTVDLWPVEPMTSATEQDEMHHAELELSLLDRASA